MLLTLQRTIKTQLQVAVKKIFELELELADITAEYPPKTELGDLAFPIAFEIAKRLKASTGTKQNPRQLADKLRNELSTINGVSRVETAGAGYINFFLERGKVFDRLFKSEKSLKLDDISGGKLIVEHTSINPNKAAHIGHLRNAVLGDTIVRMLQASGETVEIHNYIDNTGVQVADVVVGFKYLEKKSLAEIEAIKERFDYYCWDLYAQVGKFYEENPENKKFRAQTLHEIEHNEGETALVAEHVSNRILKTHLDTMWRLGIAYDVLPRESDVLHLNFWQTAFEKLKEKGAIYFETEGKNKGCWVMRAEDRAENENTAQDETESQYEADKILVRSNGTVTYTGKDIAYHLWKLGQLGLDFEYRPFSTYPNGKIVWITTAKESAENRKDLGFGNGVAYFNVIDVGQSYPQAYVKLGVKLLSTDNRIDRSAHLAYEKVVLTPSSAKELGYELSEEDSKRTQVSMSGRKGLGVKADDLIDKSKEKVLAKINSNPDYSDVSLEEREDISQRIAVSGLRYFLLKYTRSSVIAFDFEEALAFQGETGVYLLYAVVRVNSMFRNLTEKGKSLKVNLTESQINDLFSLKDELTGWDGNYLWAIVYLASRLQDTLRLSINSLEPTHLAKYAYDLARSFSHFYAVKKEGKYIYKVIDETDSLRYQLLVALSDYVRRQLEQALWILTGVEPVEKM
ncbi:MAG: arginine--tRNA ligase [Acidobacteria bacterium]|nr:arginine--tRNA ligase [Acidobacteriota bacterium]